MDEFWPPKAGYVCMLLDSVVASADGVFVTSVVVADRVGVSILLA